MEFTDFMIWKAIFQLVLIGAYGFWLGITGR